MIEKTNIVKGSDEIIEIEINLKVGQFKFNDSNLTDVTLSLYDSKDVLIRTFTKSGSTLVPMVVTYDENGNKVYTSNTDTNVCVAYLPGTSTTGKQSGYITTKLTISYSNVAFPDSSYDKIIIDKSTYKLIEDV